MASETIFYDKTFEIDYRGEKVSLRLLVDFARLYQDIENYTNKFMMIRDVPFDTVNIAPSDPLLLYAAAQFKWITDNNEIVRLVRSHYEMRANKAREGAAVLAITRSNPAFGFDPTPYPEEEKDEWDNSELPVPPINLNNPVERRLKQVYDLISSDVTVFSEFQNAMQTIFIEASRRAQERDEDGFRTRRSNRTVSKKTSADSSLAEI